MKSPRFSLFQRSFFILLLVLFLLQSASLVITSQFVLSPILKQATKDFASLVLQAADEAANRDNWIALNKKWQQRAQIEILTQSIESKKESYLIYNLLLSQKIEEQAGVAVTVYQFERDDGVWYFLSLNINHKTINIAYPHSRIGTQPPLVIFMLSVLVISLSLISAFFLSRFFYQPIKNLLHASRRLAQGKTLELPDIQHSQEFFELNNQFRKMSDDIHGLLSQRSTLLSGVSHELRTPLTRMRLAIELSAEQLSPQHYQQLIDDVEGMENIISEFMRLGKGIEAGGEEWLNVHEVLVLSQQKVSKPERIIIHNCQCDINVNQQALLRVLSNLFENAIKYSDNLIQVNCVIDAQQCHIDISDSGSGNGPGNNTGIDNEQAKKLMQPFYRSADNDKNVKGIGLGLAIVALLVRTHHWHIHFKLRDGGGTVVRVSLPIKK